MPARRGALQVKVDEVGNMEVRWVGQLSVVEANWAADVGKGLLQQGARMAPVSPEIRKVDQGIEDVLSGRET